jgi:hypothetical protein
MWGEVDEEALVVLGAALGQDEATSGTVIAIVTTSFPLSRSVWSESSVPHGTGTYVT